MPLRGRPQGRAREGTTVRLTRSLEPFNALGTGRWTAEKAMADGTVAIAGDRVLGVRTVGEMNFTI